MDDYPYPQLVPPKFIWNRPDPSLEPKVHEWISTLVHSSTIAWDHIDVTLLGIPLSRSSISASAASENPDAIRRAWKYFVPYNIDYEIDLTSLDVVDLGDVRQHVTDIAYCHRKITEAMVSMRSVHPNTVPISIGGDHSITAMLIKGWKQVHSSQKIGLLQLDTHFDLRDPEVDGPCNGTPVRNLIESGTIAGEDVWNIGLHGYFNAKSLKQYADRTGVHYVTLKKARSIGIHQVVDEALSNLQRRVDVIYLTVDMDALDISYAPGVPASTPGGMRTDELFEIVVAAAKHPKVQAMDLVCLDPHKDVAQATVKAGAHVILNFLTGLALRRQ